MSVEKWNPKLEFGIEAVDENKLRRYVEVGCPRHPGTSTIDSQLQDGACTDGWKNLANQPWAPTLIRRTSGPRWHGKRGSWCPKPEPSIAHFRRHPTIIELRETALTALTTATCQPQPAHKQVSLGWGRRNKRETMLECRTAPQQKLEIHAHVDNRRPLTAQAYQY